MLFSLIGILLGIGVSFQTAINAKLRSFLKAPFLASFVSFSVGTLTLTIAAQWQEAPFLLNMETWAHAPWWIWIGGLLGMFGLTGNILLFPKLGAVQTAIMPILGQVIMAMLIDHFGWFNAPQYSFNLMRGIGILFVCLGILCAVLLPSLKTAKTNANEKWLFLWQLLGIGVGLLLASQTAINTQLAKEIHSPVYAAWVSFVVGGAGLFLLILCYERSFKQLKNAIGKERPIWIWFGGSLGACFIFGSVLLVPELGTGGVVVLFLLGLISGSLTIDKFGLFGSMKKSISILQLIGLMLLLIGVIIIQFAKQG